MRKALRVGVLAVTIGALGVTLLPQSAQADPDAVARAKAKVEQLSMDAAALDQDALGAQEKLDAASKRLSTREGDVAAQTGKVDRMRTQVGQVALAQFQNRSLSPGAQIILRSDQDSFLSEYSTIQQVTANQNNTLQSFQTEQANLADMKRGAAADVDTIDKATKAITKSRDDSAKKLAEAQQVLDRLSAEERVRLAEEQAKEAREAEQRAQTAAQEESTASDSGRRSTATPSASRTPSASASAKPSRSATPTSSRTTSASAAVDAAPAVPAGSSRGAAALAFAKAQVGKPYIYGGTGPSGYDCSGLTGAAWKSAGVSLPRTSQAQFGAGVSVSKSQLQPGDLVFYYSGISHVGIYAGGGQIVHASRPGKPIGYAALDSMPFAGARRVG